MLEFLAAQPILLLALLLLLGSVLGYVRVGGAYLGPAAVLFVALGLTAWGAAQGATLQVPELLGSFGLVLFTYTIGITSGPSFFGSIKRGWPIMLSTVGCLALGAVAASVVGRALGLDIAVIAGTFAGALTNTPALAAASQAIGADELPALGYSISYLWGVLGMLLASAWAIRRAGRSGKGTSQLEQRTIRVDHPGELMIADLMAQYPGAVSFSRLRHGEKGRTVVAAPEEVLRPGDLVSVIAPAGVVEQVTADLGHASSHDIIGDRTHLDSNRVTLSKHALTGLRIDELELDKQFGAQVSRVRRGDVDMIPTDDFLVQLGDRLRVVAPRDRMRAIRAYLGDSERGFSDINPTGLALGLSLGILIGLIRIPLPGGGGFSLGSAAGTLIVGLVFGRLGRVGPVVTTMANSAAHALSNLGLLIFLAYAGTRAGLEFSAAVTSDLGWRIAIVGFAVTSTAAVAVLLVGHLVHKASWLQLAGQVGGAATQPAVLAFANTRTEFNNRVALGYALVYPAAMVAKILLAQLLVAFG